MGRPQASSLGPRALCTGSRLTGLVGLLTPLRATELVPGVRGDQSRQLSTSDTGRGITITFQRLSQVQASGSAVPTSRGAPPPLH